MSHDNHVFDGRNKDLEGEFKTREAWLRITEHYGWKDPEPEPIVEGSWVNLDKLNSKVIYTVREDLLEVGSKARFGDLLVKTAKQDTIVYVQPRYGFAGISLTHLAKRYNKKLVLFCPAAKEPSEHQRVAYERGAELKWRRIAAMPNLNKIAEEWAEQNDALFIPLGLRHPLVTACVVRVAYDMLSRYQEPQSVWTVLSTGVLSRGLQIAWPNATFGGIAVARNMKAGESGRSTIESHPMDFAQDAKILPPFPSATNYDAKAWEYIMRNAPNGAWFWNVAGILRPTDPESAKLDSARAWHEIRD